ncbi:MAG: ribosomal protein S18-alanine N-acetyltransferase [Pseudomonadota bacterium]
MLEYQKMTQSDLPLIMEIENTEYDFPWSEGIFRDCLSTINYHGYLLKQQQELLGYAMISAAAAECHVLNICIKSSFQKQGHGKKLLNFLLGEAKKLKAKQIFLEVRASNKVAIALYQNYGFNELGIRRGYYPANNKREDAYLFAMEIN